MNTETETIYQQLKYLPDHEIELLIEKASSFLDGIRSVNTTLPGEPVKAKRGRKKKERQALGASPLSVTGVRMDDES